MSDGWETRRSQSDRGKYARGGPLEGKERCEWVIAHLAGTGTVGYVEVDTAYHPGNYPVVSVPTPLSHECQEPSPRSRWSETADYRQACKVEAALCEEVCSL